MPGLGGILGGALQGAGGAALHEHDWNLQVAEQMRQEGIQRAREIRQDLMAQQRDAASDRNATDRLYLQDRLARERDRINAEQEGGFIQSTHADVNDEVVGLTRSGQAVHTGITVPRSTSGTDSGLSAGDQRLLNTVIERNTRKGGLNQQDVTNWRAVSEALNRQGRPDLARLVAPEAGPATIDMNSDEWRRAEEAADAWVSKQAKLFNLDSTDFAQYGGNREDARQAKTLEFYRQYTGETSPGQPDQGQQTQQQPTQPKAGGAQGSRENPYTPQTQADFDAIPSGAVYRDPDDGQLYRKP